MIDLWTQLAFVFIVTIIIMNNTEIILSLYCYYYYYYYYYNQCLIHVSVHPFIIIYHYFIMWECKIEK